MTKVLAVISFIDQHGRPVDPGFGRPGGGGPVDPGFGGGRPGDVDPDYGMETHPHPGHGLPHPPVRPGHDLPPWGVTTWPPSPVDPSWGVDGDPSRPVRPDNSLPPFIPLGPDHPDNALPPFASHKPPTNPPPGTIWPPLPPGAPEGKAAIIVWIVGVGWRYMVVDIPPAPQPK